MSIRCSLGFHTGTWYVSGEHPCEEERHCTRCRKVSTRTNHTLSEWAYQQLHACDQIRRCGRCGLVEEKIAHSWGLWSYQFPSGDCTQTRQCSRCGEEDTRLDALLSHQFDQARYQYAGSCQTRSYCSRCGAENFFSGGEIHQWQDWFPHPNDRNLLLRLCGRCGERETQTV